MKIAVCTTFPLSYYDICSAEMIETFNKYWPDECELFIGLDQLPEAQLKETHSKILEISKEGRDFFIGNDFDKEQVEFLKRHEKDEKTDNYRLQVARFSYKIFSLHRVAQYCTDKYDYLIWLDADVITKKQITLDDLKKFLPEDNQVFSYLGRKDSPHSECGFVGYNMKYKAASFIERMQKMYVTDAVLTLPGWTDCDILDHLRGKFAEGQEAFKNLSEGVQGTHVWPASPLGEFMEHRKGKRKLKNIAAKTKPKAESGFSLDKMEIKTKNCIDHDLIRAQIKENISLIKNWAQICTYNDEEIVIASAGPSLNREDLMPFYERGIKIVAVKHAVERLLEWGIKPWACVLLDPRPHVENFVKSPNKDIIYFVASMVHPSVVRTLLDNNCKVIGYHALVGAKEQEVARKGDIGVSGGSGTATRCICLLNEMFGFKTFHCFGYDLCHHTKPDFAEKTDDGNQKNYEVELTASSWGGKIAKKTFWTEGQFLAQAREIADLYKMNKNINITIYGDGIAGWAYKHWKQYEAWGKQFRADIDNNRGKYLDVNRWIDAIT